MPTSHRRINVTCDPELAAALERSRKALPGELRSEAALLRRLALAGAEVVGAGGPGATRQALLSRPGITARSRDHDYAWLTDVEPLTDKGTRALEWVRGER